MSDRRTRFWQDNFELFAKTKDVESDVNIYMEHSWARRAAVFSELADELQRKGVIGPGKLAADVGCGTGLFSRMLANAGTETVSADLCFEMLKRAAKEGGEKLSRVNAECEKLPFRDQSLDFISANGLVTILSDLGPFFGEIARTLKPGGTAMLETLNSFWLGRAASSLSGVRPLPPDIGVIHYTPFRLASLLRKAMPLKRVRCVPIVNISKDCPALEESVQRLASLSSLPALPFSSAFILLAVKR